jgi:osmoprotectant transport system permease protein
VLSALCAAGLLAGLTFLPLSAADRPILVGAKSFSEQLVLAEVLRCAIGVGTPVEVRSSLGSTVAFDALRHGELDMYVEYTGTAWFTLLHETKLLERSALDQAVAAELEARFGIQIAARLGFENAYALVVRSDDPAQSIGQLGSAEGRSFGADYEFFERPEWSALRERYGLAPRERRVMDPSLLYTALASAAVDVIAGYTTDGRIETLRLRVLDDDRSAIPPYDAIVLVSRRMWHERPDIVRRLRALEGSIDAASMRRMNARVDAGAAPRTAAKLAPICAGGGT